MTDPDNGILAQIPGQYVSAAIDQLPDPETCQRGAVMETELDTPRFGRVRFTAIRLVAWRGKTSIAFWSVTKAEVVPPCA